MSDLESLAATANRAQPEPCHECVAAWRAGETADGRIFMWTHHEADCPRLARLGDGATQWVAKSLGLW